MFGPLEDRPRKADGSLRNEWVQTGVAAFILAMIRFGTAMAQAQLEAVWQHWWAANDPIRPLALSELDRRFMESIVRDVKRSESSGSSPWDDIRRAAQFMREQKRGESP